jgi:ATP-dependent DNA helicase RecG
MKKDELLRLIALGEGQTLEFKKSLSDDLGREIVSFANSLGGTILIGVDDTGLIEGVSGQNRLKGQIQSHARNCEPPVIVSVEAIENVLVVQVPQSKDRPHSTHGRFFLREGATAQQMSRNQIREFFFKEGLLYFDSMINGGFDIRRDLKSSQYRKFAKSAGVPPKLGMKDALTNLRLLTPSGMTNAGALVLGRQGSRYLISSTVMCALFQGTTKTKILDQKLFDEDIGSNFRNAILYLQAHLNTEYVITSVRTNRLELPEEALREAVINAIAHRDYRNAANIQIFIFYDRIEIHNPGGLVGGLKLSELGKRSAPRNPLLFGILYRMDLVEHVGSGLKRIRESMHAYGLPAPLIEADEHWFTITFKRKVEEKSSRKGSEKGSEKSSEKILGLIRDNKNITIAELSSVLNVSTRAVEKHLARLQENGLLRRIGPDKGGYWEVVGK